jgi:hypothetical protein
MNRRNLDSGYPEEQAFDPYRRESDRNAGNDHVRGEYRGGRFGGTGGSPYSDDDARIRGDWYRSDAYRGHGELESEYRSANRANDHRGATERYSGQQQRYPGTQQYGYDQRYSHDSYRSGAPDSGPPYLPSQGGYGDYGISPMGQYGQSGYNAGGSERGSDWGVRGTASRYGDGGYGYQGGYPSAQQGRTGYGSYTEPREYERGSYGARYPSSGTSSGLSGLGADEQRGNAGAYRTGYSSFNAADGYARPYIGQQSRGLRAPKGYTRSDERIQRMSTIASCRPMTSTRARLKWK